MSKSLSQALYATTVSAADVERYEQYLAEKIAAHAATRAAAHAAMVAHGVTEVYGYDTRFVADPDGILDMQPLRNVYDVPEPAPADDDTPAITAADAVVVS